jgi:hypothetical protein
MVDHRDQQKGHREMRGESQRAQQQGTGEQDQAPLEAACRGRGWMTGFHFSGTRAGAQLARSKPEVSCARRNRVAKFLLSGS